MITVEDLTIEHVREAHQDIRIEDRMEWLAASGLDVFPSLLDRGLGENARVAIDGDRRVLCFWGATDGGAPGVGNAWLVATRLAEPRAIAIHKHLKSELGLLHRTFPTLQCWADSRNNKHHDWLGWLGFKKMGERYYGQLGLPFTYFRRDQLCAYQP